MEIHSNMSSSSKVINPTDLDSTTSMDSKESGRIFLEEGHVTFACKLIVNKADFFQRSNANYAKIVANHWPRSNHGGPPDHRTQGTRKTLI